MEEKIKGNLHVCEQANFKIITFMTVSLAQYLLLFNI